MGAPTPIAKSDHLIKEINAMVTHGIDFDRLNEIEIEARKIQDIHFISGKRLLGVIAGMRRDKDQIKIQFEAAINAGGADSVLLANYANALSNIGDLPQAIDLINEAASSEPDDITFLRLAVNLHLEAYDIDGASAWMKRLESLGAKPEQTLPLTVITEIDGILKQSAVDWHAAAFRISRIYDAILPLTKSIEGISLNIHEGTIFHRFELNDEVEVVAKAESAMLDAIADCPYDPVDDVIYFSCALP